MASGKKKCRSRVVFIVSIVGLGLYLALSPLLYAGGYDYKFDEKPVKMAHYETEMAIKMERGVTNVAYGWTEAVRTPIEWSQGVEGNIFKAIFIGFPYGVLRSVGRTVVGAYEMATFYAPQKPIMFPLEGDVY